MFSESSQNSWFDLHFQWIGLGLAAILLVLLFATDLLRGDKNISRWKDYRWLAWLGVAAYLVHNAEEYGVDIFGNLRAYPQFTTAQMAAVTRNGLLPTSLMYTLVNVAPFWVAAPIGALLSKRYPLAGLMVYSIASVNSLMHLQTAVRGVGLGAGNFTAIFIFLPLCVWVFIQCFRKGRLRKLGGAILLFGGVVSHAVLALAFFLYLFGKIPYPVTLGIIILNPLLLLLTLLWAERKINKMKPWLS